MRRWLSDWLWDLADRLHEHPAISLGVDVGLGMILGFAFGLILCGC